jgi:hypothetical protein
MLSSGEILYLIVEASLALAGFAGVVTVLTKRDVPALAILHRLSLINLLATAFAALFLSLTALVLLSAGLDQSWVWRVVSAGGLIPSVYFGSRSVRTVLASSSDRRGVGILLAINVPLLLVCLVQVWNVAVLGEFWPVLLLLVALFGIGCYSFVSLLFGVDE